MTPITVQAVAAVSPGTPLSIADLPELNQLPPTQREFALSLGIDEVWSAGERTEVDLAAEAASAVLVQAGLDADELDALVVVQGRAPDYLMASEATRLQARLRARRAVTLSVGDLGCVSSSAALMTAQGLFAVNPEWRTVLMAMGTRAPTVRRFRSPMTVLGDGGMAVLLNRANTGRFRLVDQVLESNGEYADLYRIPYRETSQDQWAEQCEQPDVYSFRLAMESRNRFRQLNERLLRRNGMDLSDVQTCVMQNLSRGAFEFWRDALGVRFASACRENLRRFGHLGSMDVLLNLDATADALSPGDRVLAMNSSPVAAWSSALFERLAER